MRAMRVLGGRWHLGGLGYPLTPSERHLLGSAPQPARVQAGVSARSLTVSRNATTAETQQRRRVAHLWHEISSARMVAAGPLSVGFDEFYGLANDNEGPLIDGRRAAAPLLSSDAGAASHLVDVAQDGTAATTDEWAARERGWPAYEYTALLPALTRRALAFIRNVPPGRPPNGSRVPHGNAWPVSPPAPFLLYFALTAPHFPLAVADEWLGRSNFSAYADWILQADDVVGQVLRAIDDTGTAANTIVVVTSDHGQLGGYEPLSVTSATFPPSYAAFLARSNHSSNGIYRGGKQDVLCARPPPFSCLM